MSEKIMEMAYKRQDAIERCYVLGKQFLEHFNKVTKAGGLTGPDFTHHTDVEMGGLLRQVRAIRLKENNKLLNVECLVDWFFTATGSVDDYVDEDHEDLYCLMVAKLLADKNKKVSEAFLEAWEEENN